MSEEPDPKPSGQVRLALLGWLVHVAIGAGAFCRVLAIGPRYDETYRRYHLRYPWLTEQVLDLTAGRNEGGDFALWGLAGLALFDAAVLVCLAGWLRPAWKWWFWGVTVALLLGALVVEAALAMPGIKLREALPR